MKRILTTVATCAMLFAGASAWAQDEVFLRGKDKSIKGVVAKESSKGISLKDGSSYAAETIEDIQYEVTPVNVRLASYRPAHQAEKDSVDPGKDKDRSKNLAVALKGFQDAAAKVGEPFAKRHSEYKVAVILARQAAEDGKPAEPAIDALKKFKAKNADSWQIGACLQMLGRLQLDQKDYPGAQETFNELAQANVPDDVKQDARLQSIQVSIRAGKTAEAKKGLDSFLGSAPKDSKHAVKARVTSAELMIAGKQYDEALKTLAQAGKDTTDKTLRALIYNAKGVCLFDKEDYKGARWEFLWVDVAYNQDKNEHAKALYYLWKTFEQLGDAEKAQDCLQTLLSDRAFAGTEWRTRAQKESKS